MDKFTKDSIITFITEISIFLAGFLSTIILARVLGPSGKGIYALIFLIPSIMISLGNLGIGGANVYFTASKKYKVKDITSNSFILSLILGVLLILIFLVLFQFKFFKDYIFSNKIPVFYLWLAVFLIPFSLLFSFLLNIIRGTEDLKSYNKVRLFEGFLQVLLFFGFLIVLKKGIFGAVLSRILVVLCALLFTIFLIKRLTKISFSLHKGLLKDSLSYGGKIYIANALSFLNYRFDMLLISLFLLPSAVGIYSIAVSISEKLFLIPGAVSTVLFPKISSMTDSRANRFTPRVVRHIFLILVLTAFALVLFAKPLIKIFFGSAFLPAVKPLLILLPGIIAFGIGGILSADLAGRGKPQIALFSSLACLLVNIPLNIVLIPKMGISGAALASTISYLVDTLVIGVAFLKISKRSLTDIFLIKKEDFQDYSRAFLIFKEKFWKK